MDEFQHVRTLIDGLDISSYRQYFNKLRISRVNQIVLDSKWSCRFHFKAIGNFAVPLDESSDGFPTCIVKGCEKYTAGGQFCEHYFEFVKELESFYKFLDQGQLATSSVVESVPISTTPPERTPIQKLFPGGIFCETDMKEACRYLYSVNGLMHNVGLDNEATYEELLTTLRSNPICDDLLGIRATADLRLSSIKIEGYQTENQFTFWKCKKAGCFKEACRKTKDAFQCLEHWAASLTRIDPRVSVKLKKECFVKLSQIVRPGSELTESDLELWADVLGFVKKASPKGYQIALGNSVLYVAVTRNNQLRWSNTNKERWNYMCIEPVCYKPSVENRNIRSIQDYKLFRCKQHQESYTFDPLLYPQLTNSAV